MLARLSAALAILAPALAKPGIYQVTLSDDAWIDVIQNGRYARSVGSTGPQRLSGRAQERAARSRCEPDRAAGEWCGADPIAITIGPVQ